MNMGANDKQEGEDLFVEAFSMMAKRDGPVQEPVERPDPTPLPGEELDIETIHAFGSYKSRFCRDLIDLLENNSKYRRNRWFRSKDARPDAIKYVRKALGMTGMHPAKRLGMVRKAIAENYFRGYDITPLMQRLDRFCVTNSIDDRVYDQKKT